MSGAKKLKSKKGFTLLEVLLVIATIGILAAVVAVAINPARQISQVRNAERRAEINTIYKAIEQYLIDTGTYPAGITTTLQDICISGNTVNCVDLSVLTPNYLARIPIDPQGGSYRLAISPTNSRIIVSANAELGQSIAINNLWTPARLSELALWLDAADVNTITLNGANVSQWNDKSGNNRNVSQTTASRQPVFVANSLNNNPIIAFDGTDDTLVNPGAALIRNVGGASIILVGRRRTDVASEATAVMIPTSAASRATILWRSVTAGNTGVGTGGRRLVTDSFQALGTQPYTSNYEVVISRFDYANADLRLFQNGTQTGQRAFQTAGITENDAGGLFVGANAWGSSTLNLDLAEIIIVHSALSTEQRQLLEGYLAWKWGLQASLPLGHPYYNFPPSQ